MNRPDHDQCVNLKAGHALLFKFKKLCINLCMKRKSVD